MNQVEFGRRIKMYRKKIKMTQAQLADAIGKKEVTVRKYENGTIEAPWNVIEEIASVLNISPFDLTVDVDGLRNEVKLFEQIGAAYGSDAIDLLNDFDELTPDGKKKACAYVYDLTQIPEYHKKKEPVSAATPTGSGLNLKTEDEN